MSGPPIDAVAVIVPAHDESARIGSCVRAVLTALDAAGRPATVCVLADRCTDATARLARAAARPYGARVHVLDDPAGGTIGTLRNRAADAALTALGTDPHRTWLLSTDADSTVGPDWVRVHLGLADAGADALAGGVLLDRPGLPVPPGEPPWPGHPVYGADLGLRAGSFLGVGGFPDLASGEDHGIVTRLRTAGHVVEHSAPRTVRTSPRLRARAPDGLAGRLREAHRPDRRAE